VIVPTPYSDALRELRHPSTNFKKVSAYPFGEQQEDYHQGQALKPSKNTSKGRSLKQAREQNQAEVEDAQAEDTDEEDSDDSDHSASDNDRTDGPGEVVAVISTIMVSKDTAVKKFSGKWFVRLEGGGHARAVKFNKVHAANETMDETTPASGQEDWTGERGNGRPAILYQFKPVGRWAFGDTADRPKKKSTAFTPATDDNGHIFLNKDNEPMRHSDHLPITVSTEIPGWMMEAVSRLDPKVTLNDFVDRMPMERPDGKLRRPNKGTLSQRRTRDRERMRIVAWPVPNKNVSYADQKVESEMSSADIRNNSTRNLQDLTADDIKVAEAVNYGGKLERAGSNARESDRQMFKLRANLEFLQARFSSSSFEVKTVQNRIKELESKIGDAVLVSAPTMAPSKSRKWDQVVHEDAEESPDDQPRRSKRTRK